MPNWRRQVVRSIVGLTLVVGSSSFAAPKCTIALREVWHNGQVHSTSFKSDLTSERACAVLAKFHRPNFTPEKVRSKQVSYLWKGSKASAQYAANKKPAKRSAIAVHRTRRRG